MPTAAPPEALVRQYHCWSPSSGRSVIAAALYNTRVLVLWSNPLEGTCRREPALNLSLATPRCCCFSILSKPHLNTQGFSRAAARFQQTLTFTKAVLRGNGSPSNDGAYRAQGVLSPVVHYLAHPFVQMGASVALAPVWASL